MASTANHAASAGMYRYRLPYSRSSQSSLGNAAGFTVSGSIAAGRTGSSSTSRLTRLAANNGPSNHRPGRRKTAARPTVSQATETASIGAPSGSPSSGHASAPCFTSPVKSANGVLFMPSAMTSGSSHTAVIAATPRPNHAPSTMIGARPADHALPLCTRVVVAPGPGPRHASSSNTVASSGSHRVAASNSLKAGASSTRTATRMPMAYTNRATTHASGPGARLEHDVAQAAENGKGADVLFERECQAGRGAGEDEPHATKSGRGECVEHQQRAEQGRPARVRLRRQVHGQHHQRRQGCERGRHDAPTQTIEQHSAGDTDADHQQSRGNDAHPEQAKDGGVEIEQPRRVVRVEVAVRQLTVHDPCCKIHEVALVDQVDAKAGQPGVHAQRQQSAQRDNARLYRQRSRQPTSAHPQQVCWPAMALRRASSVATSAPLAGWMLEMSSQRASGSTW